MSVFAESEINSRVDNLFMHDQVKIPVVSKANAKINTYIDQERQNEIIGIVRCNCISEQVYESACIIKEPLRDFRVSKIRVTN